MARQAARKKRKSAKKELEDLYRLCPHCKVNRSTHRYDKHVTYCRTISLIAQENRQQHAHSTRRSTPNQPIFSPPSDAAQRDLVSPMRIDSPGPSNVEAIAGEAVHANTLGNNSDEDSNLSTQPIESLLYGPHLPEEFIKIVPHPHSNCPTTHIIPLTGGTQTTPSPKFQPQPEARPWAPFKCLADFEYTETAVKGLLSTDIVNAQLAGMHGGWSEACKLSIKTKADMEKVLSKARTYFVQFQHDVVSASYKGKTYEYRFEYRDPWEWILSLIQDDSLAPLHMWNAVKKYHCHSHGDFEDRIYDEPNTADTWWDVDNQLPDSSSGIHHCFLPLHFWLDKGLVTRRVLKYPMVLRAAWLPRQIRNASGNGGGVLVGYMPVINDPADPTDRSAAETLEFAQFKREIYQKVLAIVFKTLKQRSRNGEAHRFSNKVYRVLHPGILIESQDAEEAANFCGCRAANALHPCPKCLVPDYQLHNLGAVFEPRTSRNMRSVIEQASRAATKTSKEKILKDHGLHNVKHFLWDFRFSDPYQAISYDTLHSDDLGKWGKHLWVLLLSALEERKAKGTLTERMAAFPRWSGLKHFNHVSTTHFTDGQAFFDILKCILPCIVDILPRNSSLVHCIRAYIRYRMYIGLHCMTEKRLEKLRKAVLDYEKACAKVSKEYGKNFDFLKQHASSHVVQDIREKGTPDNYCTRVGEGVQQESSQAYDQTNRKNAEQQMVQHDEKQEAIARIRMAINNDLEARQQAEDIVSNEDEPGDGNPLLSPWQFGSPEKKVNIRALDSDQSHRPQDSRTFDETFREFVASNMPTRALRFEDEIFIRRYKCVSLTYQSLDGWIEARDIMRCNSNFHGHSRFDCVVIHDDTPGVTVGRLHELLRCWLPSGRPIDVALVTMFRRSSWKPKTVWADCRVLEEDRSTTIVQMDYILRGAMLSPVSDRDGNRLYYFMDTMDPDMFLRAIEV